MDLIYSPWVHTTSQSHRWVKYLHAADDIDGLRLRAVACVLHVNNGHREVNVEASLAKISFAEHLEVWSEEILRQKLKKTTTTFGDSPFQHTKKRWLWVPTALSNGLTTHKQIIKIFILKEEERMSPLKCIFSFMRVKRFEVTCSDPEVFKKTFSK